jgi:S1-C subfamily serine protease
MLLTLCVLAFVSAQSNAQPIAAKVYAKASPSVVLIEAWTPDGTSQGSGVAVAPGLIVTNHHVVENAQGFILIRQGDSLWRGEVQALDPGRDLALVGLVLRQSEKFTATPAKRRKAGHALRVGEPVFAIGAPLGLEQTLSTGIISGMPMLKDEQVIQTDAAISKGSSGGGLFDNQGNLIGITTAYLAEGQSLNFAVPADHVSTLERQPPIWSGSPHTSLPPRELLVTIARRAMAVAKEKVQAECPPAPELPLPLAKVSAVVLSTRTNGPLLTAGDLTADWVRERVATRLKNHGIFVFANLDEARKAEKYAVTLKIDIDSLNIKDTVFYPWQMEINVLDTTDLAGGGRGEVHVFSFATFGYGGSKAVLKQVSDTLDENVSAVANMLNQ